MARPRLTLAASIWNGSEEVTDWHSEMDKAPANEPVLVTNGEVWTLARMISLPVQRLRFAWPPIESGKEWRWVFSCSKITPIDFEPTHWARPEVSRPPKIVNGVNMNAIPVGGNPWR